MCEVHVYTTGCVINIREIKAERIKIYSVTGIMNRTEYSRQKYHELLLNEHGGNADTDIHGV